MEHISPENIFIPYAFIIGFTKIIKILLSRVASGRFDINMRQSPRKEDNSKKRHLLLLLKHKADFMSNAKLEHNPIILKINTQIIFLYFLCVADVQ